MPDQSVKTAGRVSSSVLSGPRERAAPRRIAQDEAGPLILALDTTHEFGSLALVRGRQTLEVALLHAPTGFAHVLYPQLSRLLERNAVSLASVDCFAAGSGPGSFTGVRVGLACIKGLAEALGKPAIAVSNLQAVATFGYGQLKAAVIDARRGDIYGGVYNGLDRPLAPEVVMKFPLWLESLPPGEPVFVSSDFTPFLPMLAGTRFERCPVVSAEPALAGAIGSLAMSRYMAGERPDPASLDANYVRRSDAELFWKE